MSNWNTIRQDCYQQGEWSVNMLGLNGYAHTKKIISPISHHTKKIISREFIGPRLKAKHLWGNADHLHGHELGKDY